MASILPRKIAPTFAIGLATAALCGGVAAAPVAAVTPNASQANQTRAASAGWVTPGQLGLGSGWVKARSKSKGSRLWTRDVQGVAQTSQKFANSTQAKKAYEALIKKTTKLTPKFKLTRVGSATSWATADGQAIRIPRYYGYSVTGWAVKGKYVSSINVSSDDRQPLLTGPAIRAAARQLVKNHPGTSA